MKRNRINLIVVAVLLALIFGATAIVYQVRQTEVALKTTFGRPADQAITNAGAYFKWPWPIQVVHRFDRRIQNLEDTLEPATTRDNNELLCMVFVGWQISDPREFYPKFASGAIAEGDEEALRSAEAKIKDAMRSAKAAVIGTHRMTEFISADTNELKFTALEAEMLAAVQGVTSSNHYGIGIKFLGIKKLGLPESVTTEVFKQMQSERATLVSDISRRGDIAAADISSTAASENTKTVADAEAQAKSIRGQGVARQTEYFQIFAQDPELARFIFQLDALKASLNHSTMIMDGDSQPFDLLKSFSTNAGPHKTP